VNILLSCNLSIALSNCKLFCSIEATTTLTHREFGIDNLFAGSLAEISNIIRDYGTLLVGGSGRDERWKLFIQDCFDPTLSYNSSCIDAGIDVGLERDINGIFVPQGFAPDVGIFEIIAVEE